MTETRMTNAEAVILCRFAKACCPQQQFDSYTPDAWFELLNDLRFEDCKEAVVRIVKRQPFVAPAEIRDEIRLVRIDRFEQFGREYGYLEPPAHLADDIPGELAWRRAVERKIFDGEITHPDQIDNSRGDLRTRDVDSLGLLGRTVPNE